MLSIKDFYDRCNVKFDYIKHFIRDKRQARMFNVYALKCSAKRFNLINTTSRGK